MIRRWPPGKSTAYSVPGIDRSAARQVPRVPQGVGGVRVHLDEQVVAEPLAHRPHRLDVPAGLDPWLKAGLLK